MFNFHYKINCCQACSYQIVAYAVNNEGFYGTHPGSLHITTLHESLILLRGLTPPDPPPLFRTLPVVLHCCFSNSTLVVPIQVAHAWVGSGNTLR